MKKNVMKLTAIGVLSIILFGAAGSVQDTAGSSSNPAGHPILPPV